MQEIDYTLCYYQVAVKDINKAGFPVRTPTRHLSPCLESSGHVV